MLLILCLSVLYTDFYLLVCFNGMMFLCYMLIFTVLNEFIILFLFVDRDTVNEAKKKKKKNIERKDIKSQINIYIQQAN